MHIYILYIFFYGKNSCFELFRERSYMKMKNIIYILVFMINKDTLCSYEKCLLQNWFAIITIQICSSAIYKMKTLGKFDKLTAIQFSQTFLELYRAPDISRSRSLDPNNRDISALQLTPLYKPGTSFIKCGVHKDSSLHAI